MRADPSILELLEFRKALSPLRERLGGELGALALDRLAPAEDFAHLSRRADLLKEWQDLLDAQGAPQWSEDLPAVTPLFEGARRSGILSGGELLMVRALMGAAKRVRDGLADAPNPVLEALRRRLRDFAPEIEALSVVEDTGRLADRASPKLAQIREAHGGAAAERPQRPEHAPGADVGLAGWALPAPGAAGVRQPLPRACRGALQLRKLRLHGAPDALLHQPRPLMRTHEERDEEQLILLDLTRKVLARAGALDAAERVLGELDLMTACDGLVRGRGWIVPALSRKRGLRLVGARHPMLKDAAVPVDVSCGEDEGFSTLVVTGPNTGGKTVVLKTVGVFLLMAWCGLPVPARDGTRIGSFDALFADIGDEQSIEQNLSTFSAHLRKIVGILRDATRQSVVLLDELGAGTDPQEGAALGTAILETLRGRGCTTLATTHHNPIKQYALTTPGVETASMEFDAERLAPTYRLLMGVPGKSNALAIARRYGMPEEVLNRAQGELAARGVSAEELMGELVERRAALDQAERSFQETVRETERLRQAYQDRVREIDGQRDSIMEAADRRAEQLLSRAEAASKGMIRDLEETVKMSASQGLEGRRQEIRRIRSGIDRRRDRRVEREIASRPASFSVEPGVTVQVAGSGIVGVVESVKNGRAALMAGPMRVEVPLEQLAPTEKKAKVAVPPPNAEAMSRAETVPSSIMVRGMDVGTAMPLVEGYLDRAYRANHTSVTVIHGRGEGILRREVHALCARLKYVKDFRLGGEGEGGFGVTVVSFR